MSPHNSHSSHGQSEYQLEAGEYYFELWQSERLAELERRQNMNQQKVFVILETDNTGIVFVKYASLDEEKAERKFVEHASAQMSYEDGLDIPSDWDYERVCEEYDGFLTDFNQPQRFSLEWLYLD